MTTTYISHTQSTVKGGVDTELSKLNLITGVNGAGKSSIINSIELACGGFASDIMGRSIVRKTGDLIVLAQDGKKLEAVAVFNDGKSASYTVRATTKGAGKAKHNSPFTVRFPFQEVTEFLTGSSAKAREWLIRHLQVQPSLGWDAALQEALNRNSQGLLSEKLSKIIATQKQVIKDAKAEIKGSEKGMEFFSKGTQDDLWTTKPTKEAIAELRSEASKIMEQIISVSNRVTEADVERARQRAIALVSEAQKLETVLRSFQDSHQPMEIDKMMETLVVFDAVLNIQSYHLEHSQTNCTVCGSQIDLDRHTHLNNLIKQQKDQFESSTVLQREYHNALSRYEELQVDIPEAMAQFEKLKNSISPTSSVDLSLEYQKINQKAEAGERLLHHWEQLAQCKTNISEQQSVIEKAEKLLQLAEDASLEVLQDAAINFENKVNKFLPEESIFKLILTDTTCRIGLNKWGTIRFALSGAEWVQIVLAIAAATAGHNDFCIYIPEERAYDPETLSAMMKALEGVNGQVLLTSTVSPSVVPPTWNTINLAQPIPF